MFGYLRAFTPDLRMREYDTYRAVYCGLCRRLRAEYGLGATFALSYDFVFLAALWLSLAPEAPSVEKKACAINPLRRQAAIEQGEGIAYAAALHVLLGEKKLEDDLADERPARQAAARAALFALQPAVRQAGDSYRLQKEQIAACIRALGEAEAGPPLSLDGYAHHSGEMLGLLAQPLSHDPTERRVLFELGYQLGRWIYLMDALDDYEHDAAACRFNALAAAGYTLQQLMEGCVTPLLQDAAQRAASALALLPVRRFLGILENVLQQGLSYQVRHALEKKGQGQQHE